MEIVRVTISFSAIAMIGSARVWQEVEIQDQVLTISAIAMITVEDLRQYEKIPRSTIAQVQVAAELPLAGREVITAHNARIRKEHHIRSTQIRANEVNQHLEIVLARIEMNPTQGSNEIQPMVCVRILSGNRMLARNNVKRDNPAMIIAARNSVHQAFTLNVGNHQEILTWIVPLEIKVEINQEVKEEEIRGRD